MAVLAGAQLTASGRLELQPGEHELRLLPATDAEFPAEDGPERAPRWRGGVLCLTTHRLVWLAAAPGEPRSAAGLGLSCVAEVLPAPRKLFGSRTPRLRLRVHTAAGTALLSFAFRGPPPTELLQELQATLAKRPWATTPPPPPPPAAASVGAHEPALAVPFSASTAGVAGILRRQEAERREQAQTVDGAFRDLAALMEKAREMVALAERLRATLQRDTGESSQELETYLLSLGIASPVTRTTAGALFHQQLALQARPSPRCVCFTPHTAAQLADFLARPLAGAGGLLTLPDVYCLFNRARGTELVSPEDLLQACALWEPLGLGLRLRRFTSGVLAVQAAAHSEAAMAATLAGLAAGRGGGVSVADVAQHLGLSPSIARECLLAAEGRGSLCRDEAPEGLRFFENPWAAC